MLPLGIVMPAYKPNIKFYFHDRKKKAEKKGKKKNYNAILLFMQQKVK